MSEITKLNFKQSNQINQINSVLYYDDEDAVCSLLIMKSGWSRPQTYHCILEWGEFEDYNHMLLTKEQIKEKYNIEI